MKMKTPLIAALSGLSITIGSAFTLDPIGYEGTVIDTNPSSVFVPGYGFLTFQAVSGSSLVINSAYRNDNGFGGPSLNFDPNESVKITFGGSEPMNVDFDFVGQSVGESFVIEKDLFTPQTFNITFKSTSGGGAGLYAVSWSTQCVPEPTSAVLGLLGSAMLVIRRRR